MSVTKFIVNCVCVCFLNMLFLFFLKYAVSKNCMMEFRFAAIQLNLPLVLAVAGTGRTWETSEVCVMSSCTYHVTVSMNIRILSSFAYHVTVSMIIRILSSFTCHVTVSVNTRILSSSTCHVTIISTRLTLPTTF